MKISKDILKECFIQIYLNLNFFKILLPLNGLKILISLVMSRGRFIENGSSNTSSNYTTNRNPLKKRKFLSKE